VSFAQLHSVRSSCVAVQLRTTKSSKAPVFTSRGLILCVTDGEKRCQQSSQRSAEDWNSWKASRRGPAAAVLFRDNSISVGSKLNMKDAATLSQHGLFIPHERSMCRIRDFSHPIADKSVPSLRLHYRFKLGFEINYLKLLNYVANDRIADMDGRKKYSPAVTLTNSVESGTDRVPDACSSTHSAFPSCSPTIGSGPLGGVPPLGGL
jgi:hypothetical protein